jgi:epoxyqueuosine reductase
VQLLAWTAYDFLHYTEGSAIRRIGHVRWLRNLAVAAGNALRLADNPSLVSDIQAPLQVWQTHESEIVREHIDWALRQTHFS